MTDESTTPTPEPPAEPPAQPATAEPASPLPPAPPVPPAPVESQAAPATAPTAPPAPPVPPAPPAPPAAPAAAQVPPGYTPPPPPPPVPGYVPPQPGYGVPTGGYPASEKSKVVAGLLALLLNCLGIHKFYLGYSKEGIIMLAGTILFAWTGIVPAIFAVIGFIEGVMYLTKTDEEFYHTYVANKKPWF